MTKTAATKQAKSESGIFRAGSNWIMYTYHPSIKMHTHSDPTYHADAQYKLRQWRERRIEVLTLAPTEGE